MFSDAINSISWRCRPSSPRIAAAISGSACSRVAVKNESGAEAVLMLEAEELMGEISPPPQPVRALRAVMCGGRKRHWGETLSGRRGQELSGSAAYLCQDCCGEGECARASRT